MVVVVGVDADDHRDPFETVGHGEGAVPAVVIFHAPRARLVFVLAEREFRQVAQNPCGVQAGFDAFAAFVAVDARRDGRREPEERFGRHQRERELLSVREVRADLGGVEVSQRAAEHEPEGGVVGRDGRFSGHRWFVSCAVGFGPRLAGALVTG